MTHHGNYQNYYNRRPDHRSSLIPLIILENKQILDIGCNQAHLTTTLAQSHNPISIIGVDIDQTLVDSAWKHRITAFSLSNNSFPQSCIHEYGPLPIPPRKQNEFPHNLSFRCVDWLKETIPEDSTGYDVILALSITKWIHLNNKDEGLVQFFRKIHTVLHPNGHLILEPQPWESYTKAKRMADHLKANYQSLQIRPSDFTQILCDIGFEYVQRLGESGEGGFQRPLDLYIKRST